MTQMTKQAVEAQFRSELNELLARWDAEIEAADEWHGLPVCGSDIRMTVEIPSIYDDQHNLVRERCEVDLGKSVKAE